MRDQAASIATVTPMHTMESARPIRIKTRTRNYKVVATTEMHTNKRHPVKEKAMRRVNSTFGHWHVPTMV